MILALSVHISEEFSGKSNRLYQAGESDLLSKLRAETELAKLHNELSLSQSDLNAAKLHLLDLLVLPTTSEIILTDSLKNQFPRFSLDEVLKKARANHPGVKSAYEHMLSYARERDATWTNIFPDFRIAYFWQNFSPTAQAGQSYTGGEITLSLPLWAWLGGRSRINQANARHNASIFHYQQSQVKLETDARLLHSRYKAFVEQFTTSIEKYLPLSERMFKTAQKTRDAGMINYLAFLDSKQEYFKAQMLALENQYQAELAWIDILKTTGMIKTYLEKP